MNKKLMGGVAAAAMVVAMVPGMAFAADQTDTKSTDVKYEVAQGYEWTIHSEVDFTNGATVSDQTVSVTKNVIPNGKQLQIAVKGSGDSSAFSIKSTEGAVLNYAVKNGSSDVSPNGTVLTVAAGTSAGSVPLTFVLTKDSVEKAGNYTGTVTYTASIENQN